MVMEALTTLESLNGCTDDTGKFDYLLVLQGVSCSDHSHISFSSSLCFMLFFFLKDGRLCEVAPPSPWGFSFYQSRVGIISHKLGQ